MVNVSFLTVAMAHSIGWPHQKKPSCAKADYGEDFLLNSSHKAAKGLE